MKSVMKHEFSQIPRADIPRSTFSRNCGYKTTFDEGYLVPIFVDEALPGDTFNLRMNQFCRLATPIVPFMDNLFLETFFFAVPIRLIWENWKRFNGEQTNPGDSTEYLIPQIQSVNGFERQSMFDYFGLPVGVGNLSVSALFSRAYNLIYNEWFRDENLCESAIVNRSDGPDPQSDYPLRRRGKRHDYFTSCLPWPQKGPGVEVSLAGGHQLPVHGDGKALGLQWTDNTGAVNYGGLGAYALGDMPGSNIVGFSSFGGRTIDQVQSDPIVFNWGTYPKSGSPIALAYDPNASGIVAELPELGLTTINTLRQAFQIQRLMEADARGGTRYTEIIRAHFGVVSPDARLQRPEFLGGSSDQIHINPVAQTASTDTTSPQGNLAAYGVCASSDRHVISKSFTEHCVIIGLANVRADLNYQQGIDRMFSRKTRFEFYWPTLAHLGEQAVLNKEIYAQGTSADDDVFGYQERFAEYRYKQSKITGKLNSSDPQALDCWHLAQKFTSLPTLSKAFIEDDPPIERVIAVQDEPHFVYDAYFDFNCVRPMPVYSVPGMIDHF